MAKDSLCESSSISYEYNCFDKNLASSFCQNIESPILAKQMYSKQQYSNHNLELESHRILRNVVIMN